MRPGLAIGVAGLLAGLAAGAPAWAQHEPGAKATSPGTAAKPESGRNAAPAPSSARPPSAGQRAAIAAKPDHAAKEVDTSASSHWPVRVGGERSATVTLTLPPGLTLTIRLTATDDYHRGWGRMKVLTPAGEVLCDGAPSVCDITARVGGDYQFMVINRAKGDGGFTLTLSPTGGAASVTKSAK